MKQEAMARPIEAKKHLWYTYEGRKPLVLKDHKTGATLTLKKGDLYGIQNINNRIDRVVLQRDPRIRILASVESVSDAIDASKRYRQSVEFAEIEKPKPAARPRRLNIKIPDKEALKKKKRLEAIKTAVTKIGMPNAVNKKAPQKIAIPVRKNTGIIEFDDDTFIDDDDSYDISEFL